MKSLPSHTTRYWAEQAYRSMMHTGVGFAARKYRTVQGVDIEVSCSIIGGRVVGMVVSWTDSNGKPQAKAEPVRKTWFRY